MLEMLEHALLEYYSSMLCLCATLVSDYLGIGG